MSSATRAADAVRRPVTALLAVIATIALSVASAFVGAVAWAATVIIAPGTGTQHAEAIPNYNSNIVDFFVKPTGACADAGCDYSSISYLAQFWPIPLPNWGGLEGAKWDDSVADGVAKLTDAVAAAGSAEPIVIFGYSQGGTVVSNAKAQFAAQGGVPDNVSFMVIANPSRPNGGVLTRPSFLGHIPVLDLTFGPGMPTATATTVNTTDIAFQYDTVADFPRYPINILAVANALSGALVHGTYLQPVGDTPESRAAVYSSDEVKAMIAAATEKCTAATYCQISGDTRYITIPAPILPLMVSLLSRSASIGTTDLMRPLVDALSPAARVLIETGYDRRDYGTNAPFGLLPTINPLTFAIDMTRATLEGVVAAATGTGDGSRYLERLRAEQAAAQRAADDRGASDSPADAGTDAVRGNEARNASIAPDHTGTEQKGKAENDAEQSSAQETPASETATVVPSAAATSSAVPASPTAPGATTAASSPALDSAESETAANKQDTSPTDTATPSATGDAVTASAAA